MRFSWSLLKLYEQCPFKAKLIRIDKVERERAYQKRFITGTTGHQFFCMWFRRGFDEKTKPEQAAWIFDKEDRKKGIPWESHEERSRARNRVVREAGRLIEAVRLNRIDKIDTLDIEKRLSAKRPFGNHSIAGIADMVGQNNSWLLEMKMSDDPRWADSDQLIFYGLLLGKLSGKYPARLSFFLPLKEIGSQVSDIKFSEGDFIRMYNRVENLVIKWGQGAFPTSVRRETCRWCEVQTYCKNGEMTLTNSPMLPGI